MLSAAPSSLFRAVGGWRYHQAMAAIRIDKAEWYPVYSFHPVIGDEVELPDAEIARIRAVFAEFDKVQDILEALVTTKRAPEPTR